MLSYEVRNEIWNQNPQCFKVHFRPNKRKDYSLSKKYIHSWIWTTRDRNS